MTSGALLDTLSSELPVSRLVFFKDFLLSASAAASCIHLWSLHYDARHKPADHAPSGSAHVAIGRDAGEVFYVRHEKQTEVLGWSELKGQCEPVVTSCPLSWTWWTSVLLGPLCSPSLAVSLSSASSSQRTLSVLQGASPSASSSLLKPPVWSSCRTNVCCCVVSPPERCSSTP